MISCRAISSAVACLLIGSAAIAQTIGAPALTDLSGHVTSLDRFKGRMMLVNFWATWCAPCRQEMPELNQLSQEVDRRVAVVGIATDEPADVNTFVKKLGIRYPIMIGNPDQVFAWSARLGNTNEGLPFSVLLDAQGKVLWQKAGGKLIAKEMSDLIDRYLSTTQKP